MSRARRCILLNPADGTVAAQAITVLDALINRQRRKVAEWEDHHRVGMFLDEITNTPLPRLPQYLAESRGLGVTICYAAQAGSQLDAIYGPLQGRAIRDVTPAALIMYGSHERELMESAAFWAGKTTRSSQSYNHNSDDKATQRSFANALVPRSCCRAIPVKRGWSRAGRQGRWCSCWSGVSSVAVWMNCGRQSGLETGRQASPRGEIDRAQYR